MKAILKKYIGLIIGGIMVILFLLAYHLTPTHPQTAHFLVNIIAWYFSFIFTLVITLISLKLFLWGIIKYKKLKQNVKDKS